jgi:hypothetical protein
MSIGQRTKSCRGAFKMTQHIQNDSLGSFLSNAYALELTVAHKTVAEPS